jgi:hypothetical protein
LPGVEHQHAQMTICIHGGTDTESKTEWNVKVDNAQVRRHLQPSQFLTLKITKVEEKTLILLT